jgi:hypothetical protein
MASCYCRDSSGRDCCSGRCVDAVRIRESLEREAYSWSFRIAILRRDPIANRFHLRYRAPVTYVLGRVFTKTFSAALDKRKLNHPHTDSAQPPPSQPVSQQTTRWRVLHLARA